MYQDLGYNQFLGINNLPVPDIGAIDSIDLSTLVDGRLSDYVTGARTYDAIIDKDGGGDYTSIQAALDDNKTKIFVRAGTYIISSTIDITNDNTVIEGENEYSTIIQVSDSVAASFKMINIGDGSNLCSNVSISNLTIDANDSSTASLKGIYIDKAVDILIQDNVFIKFGSSATSYCIDSTNSGSSRINILNNSFDNYTEAIQLWDTPESFVTRNYFTSVANNICIVLTGSDRVSVDNNIAINVDYFIFVYASDYCLVNNNIIKNSDTFCISISEGNYNIVSNNNIYDVDKDGIVIAGGGNYNIVTNNFVDGAGNGIDGHWAGIVIYGSDTSCSYNNINGNTIIATLGNKMKYGIRENDAGCDYTLISNNIVQGAVTANISTQGANTIVSDNIS